MNNKGKITVFLCLIISSMMLLGLAIVKIVDIYSARQRVAMSGRAAMSNVRSEYNSYIFENYHILLFDMSCGGQGEGALEEQIKEDISSNLGEDFLVNRVAITDYIGIMENGCEPLKKQISEYMLYGIAQEAGENIIEITGGKDGTLPEDIEENLDVAISAEFSESVSSSVGKDGDVEQNPSEEEKDNTYDPRNYTKTVGGFGILYFVVPEGMEVSDATIDLTHAPSFIESSFLESAFQVDYDFEDIDVFEKDIKSHGTWMDDLISGGCGITYARQVFNSATNMVNDSAVLNFEVEYLICGKESDYKNLEGVVSQIIALRLPVNYTYLMKDASKVAQIKKVSWPLSVVTCVPEIAMRHLIAGCWAYVESLCEIRNLLEGKKLPYTKDSTNWITDLFDLENSANEDMQEVEKGMDYGDYLTILLAMKQEKIYLRMLDLMQINATANSYEIYIKNCAVELSVDVGVAYDNEEINFNMTTGY